MPEGAKHRHAFDAYWRLGSDRTIEALYAVLQGEGSGPSRRTLYEWSRTYRWQDRMARLEDEARRAEDEVRVRALREMYERQAKEALLLQQRGAEWLAGISDDKVSADAAIRALVEGARLERLARGEPSERQEVQHDRAEQRLAAISDADLDRLIAYAEGALEGAEQTDAR